MTNCRDEMTRSGPFEFNFTEPKKRFEKFQGVKVFPCDKNVLGQ
jgi:hypothetical protein